MIPIARRFLKPRFYSSNNSNNTNNSGNGNNIPIGEEFRPSQKNVGLGIPKPLPPPLTLEIAPPEPVNRFQPGFRGISSSF